jgi:hypothetical protein
MGGGGNAVTPRPSLQYNLENLNMFLKWCRKQQFTDSATFNCQAHRHTGELWATVVGSPVSCLRHSGFKSRPFNRLFCRKFFIKPAVLTEVFYTIGSFNWRFSYKRLLWMKLFVPADWLKFFVQPAVLTEVWHAAGCYERIFKYWLTDWIFHTTGCSEWGFSYQVTEVFHTIGYSDWGFSCFL